MCGIIGFSSYCTTEQDIKWLKALMHESKIRGLHAFGIAYWNGKEIITIKQSKLNTTQLLQGVNVGVPNVFIFHTRYSTSGDWQKEENNQPITIGNTSIVMNGVLSMKPKEEYEKQFNVKCITENDTEILLQKYLQNENMVDFINKNKEFALASLILDDNVLYMIRNNKRPLYMFENGKSKFVVSTYDIIERALQEDFKNIKVEPIYANELLKV